MKEKQIKGKKYRQIRANKQANNTYKETPRQQKKTNKKQKILTKASKQTNNVVKESKNDRQAEMNWRGVTIKKKKTEIHRHGKTGTQ